MLGLYKFYWDCGRQGELEGLFVVDANKVRQLIGTDINFGEILGKHSEIYGTIEDNDIELLTDDPDFIEQFIETVGTSFGCSPFHYLS